MARILDWDGQHLPEGLRTLPPGRYLLETVEDPPALSSEEEDALRQAMVSLAAGREKGLPEVREQIAKLLKNQ